MKVGGVGVPKGGAAFLCEYLKKNSEELPKSLKCPFGGFFFLRCKLQGGGSEGHGLSLSGEEQNIARAGG